MRNLVKIFFVSVLFVGCKTDKKVKNDTTHQHHKVEKKTEVKKKTLSPHTSTMAMIGDAHIHIDYSSPGVRDRIIFGGLLAYDMIWQAGAHKATWLETNKDLNIDGKVLPAGKYGFFVIPSKNEWTLIFKTVPQVLEQVTEHLKYKVAKTSNNTGTISLSWEKVLVKFTFEITK